jgi:hypothetical protein
VEPEHWLYISELRPRVVLEMWLCDSESRFVRGNRALALH